MFLRNAMEQPAQDSRLEVVMREVQQATDAAMKASHFVDLTLLATELARRHADVPRRIIDMMITEAVSCDDCQHDPTNH